MTKPLDQKVTDEAMADAAIEDTEGHRASRSNRGPTTDAEDTEGHRASRSNRGPTTDAEDTEGHVARRDR